MTLHLDATRFIPPEEYLEAEACAEFKSEYYEGGVFAMTRDS